MRRPPLPQLLLYVLGGTLLLALVIAASTSAASFGAYNSAWDGTAEVRDIAATYSESTVTLDGDAYTTEEPTQTLAVVLAQQHRMAQKTQGLFVVSLKTAGPCLSPITLDQQKALLHGECTLIRRWCHSTT